MVRTLTRLDICEALCSRMNLSRQQSAEVLENILEFISASIVEHGQMKITAFGTFHVRQKKARVGRNPKTGQEVTITPRKSLSFRPSPLLREKVSSAPASRG